MPCLLYAEPFFTFLLQISLGLMWSKAEVFVLLNYDLLKLRNHKIWNVKFICIEVYDGYWLFLLTKCKLTTNSEVLEMLVCAGICKAWVCMRWCHNRICSCTMAYISQWHTGMAACMVAVSSYFKLCHVLP